MRTRWLPIATLLVVLPLLVPPPANAQSRIDGAWSGQTANTLPRGRVERGLFLPLRWGITDRVEVSAYPLAGILAPNGRAKIEWRRDGPATISTVHALAYPTPLLETIARDGTGGILPANSEVPPMLTVRNGVLMTNDLGEGHETTTSFYVTTTPRFAAADVPTIDLAVAYPRTASYHTFATFRGQVDLRGPIAGEFGYRAGLDLFVLPGLDGKATLEQTGRLAWAPGPRFRMMVGYLFSYGDYPFGTQWNVYPLFDLQFAWQIGD